MPKLRAIIRGVNESSLIECIEAVSERLPYAISYSPSPLQDKVLDTLKLAKVINEDWIVGVDADVILTMPGAELEDYCAKQEEDNLFCFTGWLECTDRGLIDGMHFYRRKYCGLIYEYLKDQDIFIPERPHKAEWQMCEMVKEHMGFNWKQGNPKISMGKHLWQVNQECR